MTDYEYQVDNFMLYCVSKNLSKKTMASYEQSLKLYGIFLEKEFGITETKKIQTYHIRSYVKYLRERGKYTVSISETSNMINYPDRRSDFKKMVTSTTAANYLRNIKVFFNWLSKEKEIRKNPVEGVEGIKIERKMKETLSPEQIKNVLSNFDCTTFHGYRNQVITRLLLDTGMRVGESLQLLPEHIDFPHKSILVVNPKNKQERYVYFSPKMESELRRWLKYSDRYSSSPYLFPTNRGTKLDLRNYEKALRQAGLKANVRVHPHQLRNNFSKYYILNGGDWFSLCRILGHSSVEVTQKAYLDFTDKEIGRKYQKHSPLTFLDV